MSSLLLLQQKLHAYMEKHGWKKQQLPSTGIVVSSSCWWKYFPAPSCAHNNCERKILVMVNEYKYDHHIGYDIELRAEKPDGMWVRLQCYGIGEELPSVLNKQVKQLIEAWKAMVKASKEKSK